MRGLFALIPLCAVAACTTISSEPTANSVDNGTCRNDMLVQFEGSVATEQLGRDILHASGGKSVRWVPEGGAVTMDFRADRVTVQLDGNNKVVRASCG